MLKNKNFLKVLFTILLLVLPWSLNSSSSSEVTTPALNTESINFYQKNTCEISFFSFINTNRLFENIEIRFDSYGEMECFGKIQYIEPAPNKYVVFVGAHSLISIALQSIIWLTLISAIKKKGSNNKFLLESFLTSSLFLLHFVGEETFYSQLNLNYSKNFTNDNYLLFGYFITFFLICYFISEICSNRVENLILYVPFLFLINGAFINTNINFFVVVLVFYGFKNILKFEKNVVFINLTYFLLMLFWVNNDLAIHSYFDIDKLNGFSASTNNEVSLIFWNLTFLLVLNGLYFLTNTCPKIHFKKLFDNLLISGFCIVFFGLLASSNIVLNKIIYFYFGQNKSSMLNLQSIEGNTWRGFSSSAEMIGEFYGVILLIAFYFLYIKKVKLNTYQIVCLLFILYGFFRANNVAALTTLISIILFLFINKQIHSRNKRFLIYSFLITLLAFTSYFILRQNTYSYMSQSVVYEGLSISNIEITNNDNFQYVDRLLNERDYLSILDLFEEREEISSSLSFLTRTLSNQNNIGYIPNPVAIFGTVALFINRAEKWGTFFAKYDPGLAEFYLGYGPLNLVNYNYDNQIISNGLILPHSSVLSFLVYFGLIGTLLIIFILTLKVYRNRKRNFLINLILIFLSVNFLKSDALLYVSSFVMFSFMIFLTEKEIEYEQ